MEGWQLTVMAVALFAAIAIGAWSEARRTPEQLCATRPDNDFCVALVEKMKREAK